MNQRRHFWPCTECLWFGFLLHRQQRKRSITQRPLPAPKPQPRPTGPRCRALYQYTGQDTDEISFDVNDVIELVKEGMCVSGSRSWLRTAAALTHLLSLLGSLCRPVGLVDGSTSWEGRSVPWKLRGKDLSCPGQETVLIHQVFLRAQTLSPPSPTWPSGSIKTFIHDGCGVCLKGGWRLSRRSFSLLWCCASRAQVTVVTRARDKGPLRFPSLSSAALFGIMKPWRLWLWAPTPLFDLIYLTENYPQIKVMATTQRSVFIAGALSHA